MPTRTGPTRTGPTRTASSTDAMLLASTLVIFVGLIALSMPIVFALGLAGVAGLAIGGYPLHMQGPRPRLRFLRSARRGAAVPMVVPFVILGGFYFGVFTATEAGAIVAGYSIVAARFYYRNVSFGEMLKIAYESALLPAAVIFLLA